MPTPTKGARLGGGPAHERLMLANLATALFEHGKITTTEAKAKRLRPLAERLITFAKRGDLHARRRVMTVVRDKGVVHELFTEIGPRYENRPGGYTRITKVGPRKGDNAPMAVIELVEALTAKAETVREADGGHQASAAKKAPAKKAAPAAETARDRRRRRDRGAVRRGLVGHPGRRLRHQGQRGLDEVPRRRAARTTTAPSPRSGSPRPRPPRRPASSRPAGAPTTRTARARTPRWTTRRPRRTATHQGQRGLDEVPHAGEPVLRPHGRRGLVRRPPRRPRRPASRAPRPTRARRRTTSPDRLDASRPRDRARRPLPGGRRARPSAARPRPTTAPTSPAGPCSPGRAPSRPRSRRPWPRCCGCPSVRVTCRRPHRRRRARPRPGRATSTCRAATLTTVTRTRLGRRLAGVLPADVGVRSRPAPRRRASTPGSRRSGGATPTG